MLDSSKDNLKLEAMKRIIGVSNTAFVFSTFIFYFTVIFILLPILFVEQYEVVGCYWMLYTFMQQF